MSGSTGAPARAALRQGFGGSTFARGAGARLLLGLAVAAGALGLAWGIEAMPQAPLRDTEAPPNTHPPLAPPQALVAQLIERGEFRLARIESTFPAAWSVAAGAQGLLPSSSDATQWIGGIPRGEVVVTATPTDPSDDALHGLRISVDGAERAAWGNGAVTAVIPAPAAATP